MAVTLEWSHANDTPVQAANVVLVQGVGEEVIFSFGHAPPPIETAGMDRDETISHLNDNPIKVVNITRLVVPVATAKVLMMTLKMNFDDEASPDDDATPDDSRGPATAD